MPERFIGTPDIDGRPHEEAAKERGVSHSFQELSSELRKHGLDSKSIRAVINEENLLGSGSNGSVYRIPGIGSYVLKVTHWTNDEEIPNDLAETEDDFPEYNFGQEVARYPGGAFTFLKKQEGIPAGAMRLKKAGQEVADRQYAESLKRAADMPQSAYDAFARELVTIYGRHYQFDPSKANNVLIDAKTGKFNLVDLGKRSKAASPENLLGYMAIPLMDNAYAWKYKGQTPLEGYRKIILDKCIEAGGKVGWPIPGPGDDSSLDYSFTLAGRERQPRT